MDKLPLHLKALTKKFKSHSQVFITDEFIYVEQQHYKYIIIFDENTWMYQNLEKVSISGKISGRLLAKALYITKAREPFGYHNINSYACSVSEPGKYTDGYVSEGWSELPLEF
jgi:hypothetical protein